jgi:hypothetical protein
LFITAYTSIVARQRNESCNAKEFLDNTKRKLALFGTIAQFGRDECGLRTPTKRLALEALLLFTARKKDIFVDLNFMPKGIDGNSVSLLIIACFYYAVRCWCDCLLVCECIWCGGNADIIVRADRCLIR